ncbi:MAG: response regulator [Bacteroidales bacterium]|nr:response regulator [Bacteroidales bacterium]
MGIEPSGSQLVVSRKNIFGLIFFILLIVIISNSYALIDVFFNPDIPYFSSSHLLFGLMILIIGIVSGMMIFGYKSETESILKENIKLKADLNRIKNNKQSMDISRLPNLQALSYEVRTAMSGILTFSELLLSNDLAPEQQYMSADMIHSSGERMLHIISELLDLLRIESGHEKEHIAQVNINEQIDLVYDKFLSEANKKALVFNVEKPISHDEALIDTDRVKLNAILSHFVSNAIKFTSQGKVILGYEVRRQDEGVFSDYIIQFFVKDTGIGVSTEKKRTLFNGISPTDLNNGDANNGIGLGLFISRVYAELLGGKVGVETDETVGSKFWFQLPFEGKFSTEYVDNKQNGKESNIGNHKILIVEDDEISEAYLKEILKYSGNQLFFAHSGAVAVEMCRTMKDIDLILMDIKMPVMDGYEATKKIREFNEEVIIFAQTAYAQPKDRSKALSSGFNEHLAKPVNKKKLMELMDQYLNK